MGDVLLPTTANGSNEVSIVWADEFTLAKSYTEVNCGSKYIRMWWLKCRETTCTLVRLS